MSDSPKQGAKPLALTGVFIGAAGFAASLTCVYRGMRDLMLNSGGFCASGGAYQIAPGQECTAGQTGLLTFGILAMLVFGAVLLGASGWFGGSSMTGVGLFMWAALFGSLGYNFLDLGINPPPRTSGSGAWIFCGVLFILMALGGLIPGIMAFWSYFKEEENPNDPNNSVFAEPLVRANVNFTRSMPGDPAYGISDPIDAANAQGPPIPGTETPKRVETTNDFVDPVTGETISRGSDE